MKDNLDAFGGLARLFIIANVPFDEFKLATQVCDIFALAGNQIVQHTHTLAAFNQGLGNVRADKARTTCHQIQLLTCHVTRLLFNQT